MLFLHLAAAFLASGAFGADLPSGAPSLRAMQCLVEIQDKIDAINEELNSAYLALDPAGAIPQSKRAYGIPPASNAHEDEGVFIIHGFSASPDETKSVGVALSAAGYPVVMGLLPGFGSTTKVANAYSKADWIRAIALYVDVMSHCYRKIHLVGFSIGGGLVSNFLLTDPRTDANGQLTAAEGPVKILSATLLSPYFRTGAAFKDWLASEIHEQLGVAGVPVQLLYGALEWLHLQQADNDLKALADYPSRFNAELPLGAAEQVKALGEGLRGLSPERKSNVPVFLAYSEADKTADPAAAIAFVETHFSAFDSSRDLLALQRLLNVPHQITLEAWNPRLPMLLADIVQELGANQ
jgi:pimeloyl-ACP methyl ester carboxylesterase